MSPGEIATAERTWRDEDLRGAVTDAYSEQRGYWAVDTADEEGA
jgi:hypothetical protein